MATQQVQSFEQRLNFAISEEIRKITEEVIAQKASEAADEVARRVRDAVSVGAMRIASQYDIISDGRIIKIELRNIK